MSLLTATYRRIPAWTTCVPAWISLALIGFGCVREQPRALVVANNAEVQSLDPHIATGAPEGRVLAALWSGLTRLDPATLVPIPGLAESFHSLQQGRVWEFRLRPQLQWSDGSDLTAADVVASWRRLLDPATGAPYRDWLLDLADPGLSVQGRTLRVEFRHPLPFFAEMCAWHALAPVPESLRDGVHPAGTITSGPFLLQSHRLRDRIHLLPNPLWYAAGTVQLPALDFLVVESQFTALNLFLAGEADYLPDVPALAIPALLQRAQGSHPSDRTPEFDPQPLFATYFYRFNTTRSPWQDPRVRLAFTLAVDRQKLVESLGAGQPAATTLVPPQLRGWIPPPAPSFDPIRARNLLAEAGWTASHPLPTVGLAFNTAEMHRDVAEFLQLQWQEHLGVRVRLENQEWKVFLDSQHQLDYDLSRSSWIGDYLDPLTFLDIFRADSANNRTGWANAAFEQHLDRAARAINPQERWAALRGAEALLLQEAPILPLFHYASRDLISDRVRGFHRNLRGQVDWARLSLQPAP